MKTRKNTNRFNKKSNSIKKKYKKTKNNLKKIKKKTNKKGKNKVGGQIYTYPNLRMTINLEDDWKQLTQEILNIPGSSDSSLGSASVDVSIKDYLQGLENLFKTVRQYEEELEKMKKGTEKNEKKKELEKLQSSVNNITMIDDRLRNQINEFKYYIYKTYYNAIKYLLSIHNKDFQRKDSDKITYEDIRHISALFTLYVYIFFITRFRVTSGETDSTGSGPDIVKGQENIYKNTKLIIEINEKKEIIFLPNDSWGILFINHMSQLEDFHLEVQKKFYKYPSFSLDKYKKDNLEVSTKRVSPDDTDSSNKCFNSNLYSSLEKLGRQDKQEEGVHKFIKIPTANNILGEERPRILKRQGHI